MKRLGFALAALVLGPACAHRPIVPGSYLDYTGRNDALSGGARMIPIETPKGQTFRVWTKRTGNNPTAKVLLLHGGPGATHEYLEAFDSFFPAAGIEYYYYDQLGSGFSDRPAEPDLWDLPRFVEEVEQVRLALGLRRENFYLYGHSWGGILAMEYALKYQEHLKGLVVSNMMSSCPAYDAYAEAFLAPEMPPETLAEIRRIEAAGDTANPRYMELLMSWHYTRHVLRMPAEEWPDPVNRAFAHLNPEIYVSMQGPSELGITGKLEEWDRSRHLRLISVPTLVIGGRYDTMDPRHMEWMASEFPNGRYLHCSNGSHLAMYDDQETYFRGLVEFVRDVEAGRLRGGEVGRVHEAAEPEDGSLAFHDASLEEFEVEPAQEECFLCLGPYRRSCGGFPHGGDAVWCEMWWAFEACARAERAGRTVRAEVGVAPDGEIRLFRWWVAER